MAVGIYLTKGVLDTFDRMEKLGIRKVNRIINDLKGILSNTPNYLEKITLSKDNLKINTLKEVFEKKYTDKELEEFIKIFKNIENKEMGSGKKQQELQSLPIHFTDDFWMMLDKIDNEMAWSLIELESNKDMLNKLGIDKIDVSDKDYLFDVYYYDGKKGRVRIDQFIKAYFNNRFSDGVIEEFVSQYNKIKNKNTSNIGNLIEVPPFKFDPTNVRSTFISLVTETYPHGHEEEVLKYLQPNLTKDKYGNYYKIIGNSNTMFTSHLDTQSRKKENITLKSKMINNDEFIVSDGTTILGADDKAGVTVMCYLMANNIPGLYYFFIGEERGGIGSSKLSNNFTNTPYLKNINKVVSFDRRNYYSVITSQMGMECCSNEFASNLCDELNKSEGLKYNLDPTGIFTDSANFAELISECTNISLGCFNEHTNEEAQNITFLEKVCKSCVSVDWENLTIVRKVGIDPEMMHKYSDLISYINEVVFYNEVTIKGSGGNIIISIQFDDSSLTNAYEDLSCIEGMLSMHNYILVLNFEYDTIKILIY